MSQPIQFLLRAEEMLAVHIARGDDLCVLVPEIWPKIVADAMITRADEADASQYALKFDSSRARAEVMAEARTEAHADKSVPVALSKARNHPSLPAT